MDEGIERAQAQEARRSEAVRRSTTPDATVRAMAGSNDSK